MGALDFEKSLAVVIGIDRYSNGITPLQTAVTDAQSVAHLLEKEHEYQVLSLLDKEAQLVDLKQLIQKTLPNLLSADSRLLVYFAGHGIAQNGDDGPAGYLIPQDAVPGNIDSYLSMVWLHNELIALPCRHFLAVFDCCFAGAFRWSSTRKIICVSEVIYRERYDRFRRDPAWQVITSASYDQLAIDVLSLRDNRGAVVDSQNQQHSPFAAALIQALQGDADISPPARDGNPAGDGVITATELYLYLRDQVEVLTESLNLRQTPEICTLRNHDKGEYIFLTPGHELNLPPAPALKKENNPYRGLEAFDQVHKEIFFGRDTEIKRLLEKLNEPHPMIVVLGASGTGKSSLVKAGLLPRIADNSAFRVLSVMRPGNYPLEALARVCMDLDSSNELKGLSRRLSVDETVLSQLIDQWQRTHPKIKLLLTIDQAEELITQSTTQAQSKQFQRLVRRALADHYQHFRVIATLRIDFEAHFQNEELCEYWMDSRFVIPTMTQAQLREVIEKPAAARVLHFEPLSLVDKLVENVTQMSGALPLLSFTLSELYLRYLERCSDNRALIEADYLSLGGVAGALTQRANKEYELLVSEDDAYKKTFKNVMLRMVALEGNELARRRVLSSELVYADKTENERVQKLLNNLIAARLVVRGQEGKDKEPYVEPSHDALVRGWDKLLLWKNSEQVNLGLRRELLTQSRNWLVEEESGKSKRSRGFLWNGNPHLDLVKSTLDSDSHWLNATEERFVRHSVVRNRNRRTLLISSMATATIVLSAVSVVAILNAQKANRQTMEANLNNVKASINAAAMLKASGDNPEAMIMALRAAKQFSSNRLTDKSTLNRIKGELYSLLFQKYYEITRFENQSNRVKNILGGTDLSLEQVKNVRFSPDGNTILTASADRIVRLWDIDGALIHTLEGHEDSLTDMQFSPDGNTLLTASHDGTAKLWGIDGALIHTLEGHTDGVSGVRFSPDGNLLLTASYDGSVKLWNANGSLIRTIEGHGTSIYREVFTPGEKVRVTIPRVEDVRFSPDGRTLATANGDGTTKLWNTNGSLIRTLEGGRFVRFSPNGNTIVTASNSGTASLWHIDGSLVRTFGDKSDGGYDAHFSPDGNTLLINSANSTKLWNIDGSLLHTLEGHENRVTDIRFSPNGNTIVTGSYDGTVNLWNIDGSLIHTLEGHEDQISSVRFSPDGNTIVTGSNDGTVKLWQVDYTFIRTIEVHSNSLSVLNFSPDGNTIITGSNDGTAKLWNTGGSLLHTLEGHEGGIYDVQFSHDSDTVATASYDGTAKLWNIDGSLIHTLEGHEEHVYNVQFSPNGDTVATVGDGTVKLWNIDGSLLYTLGEHKDWVSNVRFSPDGNTLLTSNRDNTAKLWNIDGSLLYTLEGHKDRVSDVRFSPDGNIIATASYDGTVKLWSTEGSLLHTLEGHMAVAGHVRFSGSTIWEVRFSPDGNTIATAGNDGTARLWSTEGLLLHTLEGHRSVVWEVHFSPDGNTVATASYDGTAKLWNIDGSLVHTLKGNNNGENTIDGVEFVSEEGTIDGVEFVRFSPDGNILASGHVQGVTWLWPLSVDTLTSHICQSMNGYLLTNLNVQPEDRKLCD